MSETTTSTEDLTALAIAAILDRLVVEGIRHADLDEEQFDKLVTFTVEAVIEWNDTMEDAARGVIESFLSGDLEDQS